VLVPFELTINRVGALAGTTGGNESDLESVRLQFARHLESVVKVGKYGMENIVAEAPNFKDLGLDSAIEPEARNIRIRKASIPPNNKDQLDWTLIGTLPGARFQFTATSKTSGRSRDWITHARASVTACALQPGRRNTKIWWTFEGVSANEDPNDRPISEDISAFITFTDRMADAAIEPLYDAFHDAVAEMTSVDMSDFRLRKNRIRIRMTDSNDYDVEALVDAVYYQNHDVSKIRNEPDHSHARQGLCLFERFVRDVTHLDIEVPDKSLEVEARYDGFKGIFYRTIVRDNDTIVAGFGHQSGSVSGLERAVAPEKRRLEKQEGKLRAMSPSRPISAMLADREAARHEA
jgi:hypothetical protein